MLKKIVAFLLTLTISLSLSSCKKDTSSRHDKDNLVDIYLCAKIVADEDNMNYYQEYLYDSNHNITELAYSENGERRTGYTYNYDSSGNVVQILHPQDQWYGTTISSQDFEYEYNSDGTILQMTTYKDGYKSHYNKYEYDSNGQLVLDVRYSNSEQELDRTAYKYDRNGNLIQKIRYDDTREITNTEYSYDDNGNLIKEQEITFPTACYEYEYEFSNNNCTMRKSGGDTISLYIYKKVRVSKDTAIGLRNKHGNTLVLFG